MVRRRLAAALLPLVLLPLAACVGAGDRGRGGQQIGLTLDPTGAQVVIVTRACAGQSLTDAAVWQLNKKGSQRQRELWGVTASAAPGGSSQHLVVGQRPEGFTEETALAGALPADSWLEGVIQQGDSVGLRFRVGSLRKDTLFVDPAWFHNHRYVSAEEFEKVNAQECGRG